MSSRTININKLIYVTSGMLLSITLLAFLTLISSRVSADDSPTASSSSFSATATTTNSASATASVNVSAACTLSGGDNNYTGTITPGTYVEYGPSTIKAVCNDSNGFSLYAIGYSGDSYTADNHNKLIASTGSDDDIPTISPNNSTNTNTNADTTTNTNTSYWAMRLNPVASTHTPTITNDYDDYSSIPATYTKVASYPSSTMNPSDPTTKDTGSTVQATYKVNISSSQPAGTYTGAVRYTLVHPHNAIPQDKYYMQDFTLAMCETLANSTPITVYDKRDNEPYLVQYLKDGNCWMLDNLRLGSNEEETLLSPLDTNIKEPWTLPKGITEGFAGYTEAHINAAYKDDFVTSYGLGSGKIGVYYNFCAASGGTYCYSGGEGQDAPGTLVDSLFDVCPAGWRMPTGSDEGEYQTLYDEYSAAQSATNPNSLQHNLSAVFSGNFFGDTQNGLEKYNVIWASTLRTSSNMYGLYMTSDRVVAINNDSRYDGGSIRCLADNS